MRRICVAAGAALLAGCSDASPPPTAPERSQAPAAAVTPSGAALRAIPETVDYGFVSPHTTLKAEVRLVNSSSRPITILAAKPSCQCTTVDLEGKVIPARGELVFPISMKVSSTGQKLANLQIAAEGMDSLVRVDLKAEVVYPIRGVTVNAPGGKPDPFIDAFTNPARVRGEATIESLDGAPFKVVSVGMKPPRFLDWDESLPARASYRVAYDVSAPDCASMPRYLIIETDRADAPLIDMRVRHNCTRIEPKVSFAEFRANAGIMSRASPGIFEIEIKHLKTPAGMAKVLAVASSRPDIAATLVDQISDGESVLATVRLTPSAGTAGVMLFPVRFTVGVPGQPGTVSEDLLVYGKVVESVAASP